MRLPCTMLHACKLPTPSNQRSATWHKAASHAAQHRADVVTWCKAESLVPPPLPLVVTFSRIGDRVDDDNLPNVFKHLRDGFAQGYLGLKSDSTPLITWRYLQQPAIRMKGAPYTTFAHIKIEARS